MLPVPGIVKSTGHIVRRVGPWWFGSVLSLVPTILGAWQFARGSHRTGWFWLFVAALVWIAFMLIAYHGVRVERDAATLLLSGRTQATEHRQRNLDMVARRMVLGRGVMSMLKSYSDVLIIDNTITKEQREAEAALKSNALTQAREWEESTHDSLRKQSLIYAARFRHSEGLPDKLQRDPLGNPFGVDETTKMLRRRLLRLEEISHQIEDAK